MDEINQEELKDNRTTGKKWWIPLALALIFTPIAIFSAVLSQGFGHGSGWADDILFPLHRPLRIAIHSENIASSIIYFLQYFAYGSFLSYALYGGYFKIAFALLIVFHVCCYYFRYWISDILHYMGF